MKHVAQLSHAKVVVSLGVKGVMMPDHVQDRRRGQFGVTVVLPVHVLQMHEALIMLDQIPRCRLLASMHACRIAFAVVKAEGLVVKEAGAQRVERVVHV